MFMGKYNNSIDAKNRMIVPSKHRDQLGGRCILTKGMDNCLYIYPLGEWEKVVEKVSALPQTDVNVRKYIRDVFANAEECEIDKQGRILIPAELKKRVFIDKELVTMGAMSRIEIWSKEVWEDPDSYPCEEENDFISQLTKYGF
ncbi:MAG: division/cell wall cluster transcriptional repressor MraZ [Firmicutes bacterium]|nr:division/cell wall cluster transcriptional repressor MraZ [Bacillota bacterium]